jgi:hypothetical protein
VPREELEKLGTPGCLVTGSPAGYRSCFIFLDSGGPGMIVGLRMMDLDKDMTVLDTNIRCFPGRHNYEDIQLRFE